MESKFSKHISKENIIIALSVGIWWTANSITAVTSKTLMRGEGKPDKTAWSDAIKDFRWLELTFLQHLIGAVVSIVWIKLVSRKSIWPTEGSKKNILISSVGNVVGNLSTNAAYAIVSSSMTQVVKACEPLFMFGLSLFLYRDYKVLNSTSLLAIVIMVIGASLFVAFDSTFLVTGLLAAICSNIAFPIRNIYLKKLSKVWENAFQKYAVLSINSVFVLTPIIFMKLVFFQSISLVKYWHEGLFSSFCHCTYNLASIYVLQSFTPLSHAILNLLKRGIVIIANMAFFQLPISWKMIIGLAAVLIGLYIYLYRNVRGEKFSPPSLLLVLFAIALGSVFFIPSASISTVITTFKTSDPDNVNGNMNKYLSVDLSNLTNDLKSNINKLDFPIDSNSPQSTVIRSAWVYDRPFSHEILSNLDNLTKRNSVIVYCGNSHCMDSIKSLHNEKITAEFLLLGELFKDTPLESWLSKHSFFKILAQASYEDHLQEAVRLCLLLKYGGVYIDPNVQIQVNQTTPLLGCTQPWISSSDNKEHFRLACFQPQDPSLIKLSKTLADTYYKPTKDYNSVVSFDNVQVLDKKNRILTKDDYSYTLLSLKPNVEWNHHYGTLSFDTRVSHTNGIANAGDEIQDFPGLQFLPFLDNFLDRDKLTKNKNTNQSITAFFNAWWGDGGATWPPGLNIKPLLFSIHIDPPMKKKWITHTSYLKERAPIGCRDYGTLTTLSKIHIPSYFSGCMTIMLQVKSKRTDEIFIADVKNNFFNMLPKKIRENGIRVKHDLGPESYSKSVGRFTEAFNIIERYSRAKLVITQRIHSALPCVGMGTPVIFINSASMPGGGGSKTASSARTVGLTTMFHTLDMYKITTQQGVRDWFAEFPWDNPPPNPDMATMMRLRATFWYQIRERPSLFDSAHKFGLIPLHPPSPCTDRMEFHILFLLPDSQFTWQDHRSIESILRYHPCANVRIHSDTFDDSRLNVFRESGYQVNKVPLDHGELFRKSKLEMFETAIQNAQSPLRKSLLRAAILYKWGGFYMDSNVIITRSLANFPTKFLAWNNSSKTEIDTSFMRFPKKDENLEKVIEIYSREKANPNVDIFAQLVLLESSNIEILAPSQYYGQLTLEQCYKTGKSAKALKDQLSSSVAVSLPTDYSVTKTIGTQMLDSELICTQLLRDCCVLCSKLLHSV